MQRAYLLLRLLRTVSVLRVTLFSPSELGGGPHFNAENAAQQPRNRARARQLPRAPRNNAPAALARANDG
eukprot:6040602-Lingulodinium_polyedra.AAC.1